MFPLFFVMKAVRLVLGFISNLRSLVSLVFLGTLIYLGYQWYHNGHDIGEAVATVKTHYVGVFQSCKATALDVKARLLDN